MLFLPASIYDVLTSRDGGWGEKVTFMQILAGEEMLVPIWGAEVQTEVSR